MPTAALLSPAAAHLTHPAGARTCSHVPVPSACLRAHVRNGSAASGLPGQQSDSVLQGRPSMLHGAEMLHTVGRPGGQWQHVSKINSGQVWAPAVAAMGALPCGKTSTKQAPVESCTPTGKQHQQYAVGKGENHPSRDQPAGSRLAAHVEASAQAQGAGDFAGCVAAAVSGLVVAAVLAVADALQGITHTASGQGAELVSLWGTLHCGVPTAPPLRNQTTGGTPTSEGADWPRLTGWQVPRGER